MILASDDEDTIMKAMYEADQAMADNGHPLDLDPKPPAPKTPERAPREAADDDGNESPTGAEGFHDDQETTDAKALIKELEEFRVSRFDQTSNFGTVTITGDNGNTKEITVTPCLYNTLAKKFYLLDGKLDHNLTTKSLAAWCTKHMFVDTGNMAPQMQSFKSEINLGSRNVVQTVEADGRAVRAGSS